MAIWSTVRTGKTCRFYYGLQKQPWKLINREVTLFGSYILNITMSALWFKLNIDMHFTLLQQLRWNAIMCATKVEEIE